MWGMRKGGTLDWLHGRQDAVILMLFLGITGVRRRLVDLLMCARLSEHVLFSHEPWPYSSPCLQVRPQERWCGTTTTTTTATITATTTATVTVNVAPPLPPPPPPLQTPATTPTPTPIPAPHPPPLPHPHPHHLTPPTPTPTHRVPQKRNTNQPCAQGTFQVDVSVGQFYATQNTSVMCVCVCGCTCS